ncbi:hypothetical protein NP493_359g05013 [Ridgeia piscesae]|uniref:guanylate cyclase n=1 Tax=Ridgeia piscesae TaxID=27915 RepID=A0AAD9NW34_RIDPI|nr:hypothetical protein NP493_359g05013 [Ridgeia piscesae]
MMFLHKSPIGSHGNLTSRSVVIDNKWVCKVTDYGLTKFRSHSNSPVRKSSEEEDAENLLWTAPELLRMSKRPAIGTQKGDIYSFGVITQEIVTMTKPFGMEQQFQSPADILQRLIQKEEPVFRPSVPEDACNTDWMALMRVCWIENPVKRPSFKIIYKFINDCADER